MSSGENGSVSDEMRRGRKKKGYNLSIRPMKEGGRENY